MADQTTTTTTKSEASSSGSSNNDSGNINRGESVVEDCGKTRSTCGYCKSPGCTSFSHGLLANSLTVDDYQGLLDRGWRRSGCYLYKPEMERTCCPSYTIRLKASDFSPSKEQLRVSRRMERFLNGTLDAKKPVDLVEDPNIKNGSSCAGQEVARSTKESPSTSGETNKEKQVMHHLSNQIDNAVESNEFSSGIELPKASVKKFTGPKRKLLVQGSEDLRYSSNIAFQISATLRRVLSKEQDARRSGHGAEENDLSAKTIAEKLASYLIHLPETYGLSVRACNGHINFYFATKPDSTDEDVKMVTISKDAATVYKGKDCCMKNTSEVKKMRVHLKRSSFDPEEYALYKRYQLKVHNDTLDHLTKHSYKRFLVDTPLIFVPPSGNDTVPPCGFGSFHQQYVIDGKLVAVGVIDILPKCLSSKYLFWDPDYAFLSLGKYSALQEIEWVKENQAFCSSLQYYYLGYYIHSCSKMRYKAAYRPPELLCPLRYQWVPYDISWPLLDRKKYVVLSDISRLRNGESLPPHISASVMELEHDDIGQEERLHAYIDDDDEEMVETESESSEDDLDLETSDVTGNVTEGGDISNILVGLQGSRIKYKELELKRAFDSEERKYWESQLYRYQKAVGVELSKRIVYSLG